MRGEARQFTKFSVGDGTQIHLWFDDWHSNGILHEKYGHRVIYDAQSKLDARLSNVIKDGQWSWRPARYDTLVDIQSKLSLIPLGEKDTPKWAVSKSVSFLLRYLECNSCKTEFSRVVEFSLVFFLYPEACFCDLVDHEGFGYYSKKLLI